KPDLPPGPADSHAFTTPTRGTNRSRASTPWTAAQSKSSSPVAGKPRGRYLGKSKVRLTRNILHRTYRGGEARGVTGNERAFATVCARLVRCHKGRSHRLLIQVRRDP